MVRVLFAAVPPTTKAGDVVDSAPVSGGHTPAEAIKDLDYMTCGFGGDELIALVRTTPETLETYNDCPGRIWSNLKVFEIFDTSKMRRQRRYAFPSHNPRSSQFDPSRSLPVERACWAHPSFQPTFEDVQTAIMTENAPLLRRLLLAGADPNGVWPMSGLSHLMTATTAAMGEQLVPILLSFGANVNAVEHTGKGALTLAVLSRWVNPRVVRLLIEAGADVNRRDNRGKTALTYAELEIFFDFDAIRTAAIRHLLQDAGGIP